jgi:hypothetical protein
MNFDGPTIRLFRGDGVITRPIGVERYSGHAEFDDIPGGASGLSTKDRFHSTQGTRLTPLNSSGIAYERLSIRSDPTARQFIRQSI